MSGPGVIIGSRVTGYWECCEHSAVEFADRGIWWLAGWLIGEHLNRLTSGTKEKMKLHIKASHSKYHRMLHNSRVVIALGGIALLTACASTKQSVPLATGSGLAPSDPDAVRIYLMRPGKFVGGAASFVVQEGDTVVGRIGPGGCLCWERPPGEVRILDPNRGYQALKFTAEKGQTYYVKFALHMMAMNMRGMMSFELLSEQQGKRAMKKCSPPKGTSL